MTQIYGVEINPSRGVFTVVLTVVNENIRVDIGGIVVFYV
jgi:hypothetical protein